MAQPQPAGDTQDQILIWQTIRASIGTYDELVMTLLTQATAFVFAAFGIVIGSTLKPFVTSMLCLGIWRYSSSIEVSVAAAQELERDLFQNADDPRRVTHRLAQHPLAAARRGGLYYRCWASMLVLLSVAVIAWLVI